MADPLLDQRVQASRTNLREFWMERRRKEDAAGPLNRKAQLRRQRENDIMSSWSFGTRAISIEDAFLSVGPDGAVVF